MKKLAIIGGGAAGLTAAIAAGEALRAAQARAEIVVYEADERLGRSILATGNGRCNFSNAHADGALYRNAPFVGRALDELTRQTSARGRDVTTCFTSDPVHQFFFERGLVWREESEGRLYPLANKATSVLEVLRGALHLAGATEACERRAVRIDAPKKPDERFHIRFADGAVEHADAVIVAVGGRVASTLLPPVIPLNDMQPVLGPLRTETAAIKSLNNVRVRCAVSLVSRSGELKAHEVGEILFRDYGVSGIAVFNLSRFAQPGDVLSIDFLPHVPEGEAEAFLRNRLACLGCAGKISAEDVCRGMLLPAVARVVLKAAGMRAEAAFGDGSISALARALKAISLEVQGIGDVRQCQVQRGGVRVDVMDASTMEVQAVPGLYVVGEALDVDAPCGGYNLHWAWASGLLAGRAAARFVAPQVAETFA